MVKYQIKEIKDKKVWEDFVLSRNSQSFLQSWNWGEVNREIGKKIVRYGYYYEKEAKLAGVCLIIVEKAKRGKHLLIPGGPLIDWKDNALLRSFLNSTIELAKKEKALFIRVRPELLDSPASRNIFSLSGFIPSPMHVHAESTWVLNIEKSDDELLSGMRKTTRYLVKRAIGSDLVVVQSKKPEDVKILAKLQKQIIKRHKFIGFSEKLFKAQIVNFAKDDQAILFICKQGKKPLVICLIIFYGECSYYHHSASSEEARRTPASYLIQWRIIKEAQKRGCKYYNFWGVSSTDNPKHRFAGVTTFKKGFGGKKIDWLHAQDLPLSKFYWLTYVFESVRRI